MSHFSTTFRQSVIELGMFRTLAAAFSGVLMLWAARDL
jgi:hypothetical protein